MTPRINPKYSGPATVKNVRGETIAVTVLKHRRKHGENQYLLQIGLEVGNNLFLPCRLVKIPHGLLRER